MGQLINLSDTYALYHVNQIEKGYLTAKQQRLLPKLKEIYMYEEELQSEIQILFTPSK